MSKPRIFISSTFFDLKTVRADMDRFIREMGYESVLNERGQIPYRKEELLEDACYKEIEFCDVLVSVIGGRYGSPSKENPYSISQKELKTAIEMGKPVYVFIENEPYYEYRTYVKNKHIKDMTYVAADNIRIYQFLEEIESLPLRQPIAPFQTSRDITDYLKEQWAGLFQRLLQESSKQTEVQAIQDIKTTANTLKELVTFLTKQREKGDETIKDILLNNHPIFNALRKKLGVNYRVYFTNQDELREWLAARSYTPVEEKYWDNPLFMEWTRGDPGNGKILKIAKTLFDKNNKLKVITPEEWKDGSILQEDYPFAESTVEPDDIPF